MLEIVIPRLNNLSKNENKVYFQQDGAPPHFHVNVRNFLDRTFNQRWIGRRGCATNVPPRSPDLTPLDFYLWGTLKNAVYSTKPQSLEELRDQIEHSINDIPLATIQTVCRSVRCRCRECTVVILNMHGLKEVEGIEHNTNCIRLISLLRNNVSKSV